MAKATKSKTEKKTNEVFASKEELIKKYGSHTNDSGSTEVQIALLTNRIAQLTGHLKQHGKDSDSRRGLLMMVGKRRRLLNFVAKNDQAQYERIIKELGLRK